MKVFTTAAVNLAAKYERQYRRRTWRKRANVALVVLAILTVLALIFDATVWWYRVDQSRRNECEATGGRVIEVHRSLDDRSWMCWR